MGAFVCKAPEVDPDFLDSLKSSQTDCGICDANEHDLAFFLLISTEKSSKQPTQLPWDSFADSRAKAQFEDTSLSSKRHKFPKKQPPENLLANSNLKDAGLAHEEGQQVSRNVSVKSLKPLPPTHQEILMKASMLRNLATAKSWTSSNTAMPGNENKKPSRSTEWKSAWKSADFLPNSHADF